MESKVAASQFGLAGSQTQTRTTCLCIKPQVQV